MTPVDDAVDAYRDDGVGASLSQPRVPMPSLAIAGLVTLSAGVFALVVAVGASPVVVLVTGGAAVLIGTLRASAPGDDRTRWTVPPALRVLEYGAALSVGANAGGTTAAAMAFLYLLAVGYHHYDVVYRLRYRGATLAPSFVRLLGGWEVRTVALVVSSVAGIEALVLGVLGSWCGVLAVGESIKFWAKGRGGPVEGPTLGIEEME